MCACVTHRSTQYTVNMLRLEDNVSMSVLSFCLVCPRGSNSGLGIPQQDPLSTKQSLWSWTFEKSKGEVHSIILSNFQLQVLESIAFNVLMQTLAACRDGARSQHCLPGQRSGWHKFMDLWRSPKGFAAGILLMGIPCMLKLSGWGIQFKLCFCGAYMNVKKSNRCLRNKGPLLCWLQKVQEPLQFWNNTGQSKLTALS